MHYKKPMTTIGIVGGGISGLLAAHFLQKKNHDIILWETSSRVGGHIHSEKVDNVLWEWGPQSLLLNPLWEEVLNDLQLKPLFPSATSRTRFIWKEGKLHPLRPHFLWFFKTSLLSRRAKISVLLDLFRMNSPLLCKEGMGEVEYDKTISDFFLTFYRPDVLNYLVQPFLSGVYAGEASQLSVQSCFPTLWDQVKKTGSLTQSLLKLLFQSKFRFVSFENGMESLVRALFEKLKSRVHLHTSVLEIQKNGEGWNVKTARGEKRVGHLILACPSFGVASLLKHDLPHSLSSFLNRIPYQSMCVWNTIFDRPLDFPTGVGCLIPRTEGEKLLGSLWPSEVFPGRCPAGKTITTQYFSGHTIPEKIDQEISFLKKVLNVEHGPQKSEWHLLERAIPQFQLDHRVKIEALRQNLPHGVTLVGNYLDGVGLSDVIKIVHNEISKIEGRRL